MNYTRLVLLCLCCCLGYRGFCQGSKEATLSQLKAPSAPAFTVLDVQPNDISRPKDFNALEFSLLNAASNNNVLSLPSKFALEATPFWLGHPNVTFSQLESSTDLFKTLYRTLSISIATSQRNHYVDSTRKVNQLGIGFRTYLAQGRLANRTNVAEAENTIKDISAAIQDFNLLVDLSTSYLTHNPRAIQNLSPEEYRALLLDLLRLPFTKLKTSTNDNDKRRATSLANLLNSKPAVRKEYYRILFDVVIPSVNQAIILGQDDATEVLDDLKDQIDGKYNQDKKFLAKLDTIRTYREKRVGWLLEVAGALGLENQRVDQRSLNLGKSGLWLTLTHRPENIRGVEAIFLVRYLAENSEVRRADNYDVGSRIVYDNGKLILSGEALHRSIDLQLSETVVQGVIYRQSQVNQYWRWGFNVGYRITQNIVIQGSFAKSLDSDLIYKGGFVSLLGVNFGFGQPTLIADQK